MRIPFTNLHIGAQPEFRASYTDAVVDLLLRRAIGSDIVNADETAAVEFAVSLISRCCATAELMPKIPAVTPSYLADTARRLMVSGNAVSAIDVSRQRGLTLIPASSFDLAGGPISDSHIYSLELPGPTRNETRILPFDGVLHVKVNADAAQPWIGVSPLIRAGFTATLVARLEQRLSEEARSKVGYLLPYADLTDPQIEQLKADLAAMNGNVGVIPTSNAPHTTRGALQNGPTADYVPRRFGATIPESNLTARRDANADIVSALGVPSALFVGGNSGVGLAESYRIFAVSTLDPLGELVAQELADKLDAPGLVLRFDRTAGSDVIRRSKSYQTLIEAKVDPARAARIAGVT